MNPPVVLAATSATADEELLAQLAADGLAVRLAHSPDHARALADATAPALVLLCDLGEPRGPLELLAEIRDTESDGPWDPDVSVLVLGPSRELDVLRAFEAGADDVVAAAVPYLELRARVRALLRRGTAPPRRHLSAGRLEIDTASRTALLGGRPLALSRLEFELLARLASAPDRVHTRDELLRTVWGFRAQGRTRTLDSHASRLRRKLAVDGDRWIVNVWGVGYRLTG